MVSVYTEVATNEEENENAQRKAQRWRGPEPEAKEARLNRIRFAADRSDGSDGPKQRTMKARVNEVFVSSMLYVTPVFSYMSSTLLHVLRYLSRPYVQ